MYICCCGIIVVGIEVHKSGVEALQTMEISRRNVEFC